MNTEWIQNKYRISTGEATMTHMTSTGQGPKVRWSINRGALGSVLIPDLTPVLCMQCRVRLALQHRAAVLQAQLHLHNAQLDIYACSCVGQKAAKKKVVVQGLAQSWTSSTVWSVRPTDGGAPKRRFSVIHTLHANAPTNVWRTTATNWSSYNKTAHILQGAHWARYEAGNSSPTFGVWIQIHRHAFRLACTSQHHLNNCQRGNYLVVLSYKLYVL